MLINLLPLLENLLWDTVSLKHFPNLSFCALLPGKPFKGNPGGEVEGIPAFRMMEDSLDQVKLGMFLIKELF